jgi:hypothetical protein
MVKLVGISALIVFLPYGVYAELTKQELQEIQAMFEKQEQRIQVMFEKQERILKEHVDTRMEAVEAKIAAVDAKAEAVRESVATLQWAVGIIGVLVVAILGAPQWVTLIREKREAGWQNLVNARLEEMRRELEAIKRS